MTDLLNNNRKRFRSQSNEPLYEVQTKYFVNQQMIDYQDQSKMKQIHGKISIATNSVHFWFIKLIV